ncbi:MAG: MFS transporter [Clostridia bacterium]|nr:MFS transporter [Clostridia bacterium]
MKKIRMYFPAVSAFLVMMAFSFISTGFSFFVAPVSEALGVGRGSFTTYYSILTAVGAITVPFVGRAVGKIGVKPLLLLSAVWGGGGMWLFSFSSHLWMFYCIAALMGVFAGTMLSLCANVIMQKNFEPKVMSALLGVVMAGSGVGGMLTSAVMPGIMENLGWRMGYRVLGTAWLVLLLLSWLLLGKEKVASVTVKVKETTEDKSAMFKDPRVYLLALLMCLLAAGCGILQQVPAVLGEKGFSSAEVAGMMSLMTAMLALGKILQGILYSSVGVKWGGVITISMFSLSYVLLFFKATAYPGLVLLAVGLGIYTTMMPLATTRVVSVYNFAAVWGFLSMFGSMGTIISNPAWGIVFDFTGSYDVAIVFSAIMLAAVVVLHFMLVHTAEKNAQK